jgi:hypothetical protein
VSEPDFVTLAAEIGKLVAEKNAAYGSSFAKCGEFLRILYPAGIKPDQYHDALLVVRIFDKLMRIATAKDALGENPYRDIAGYGLLGASMEKPRWFRPEEKDPDRFSPPRLCSICSKPIERVTGSFSSDGGEIQCSEKCNLERHARTGWRND